MTQSWRCVCVCVNTEFSCAGLKWMRRTSSNVISPTIELCAFLRCSNSQEDLLPPGVAMAAKGTFTDLTSCSWGGQRCNVPEATTQAHW